MTDVKETDYATRRAALVAKYTPTNQPAGGDPVATGGVDHLALICSDIGCTIKFYIDHAEN